eukprot:10290284-Lingulodinium_polyedra.AAC.1
MTKESHTLQSTMIGSQHPAFARDAMSKAWHANCSGWRTPLPRSPQWSCSNCWVMRLRATTSPNVSQMQWRA